MRDSCFIDSGRGNSRPSADRLGLHRLTAALILIQAGFIAFDIIGFRVGGLTFGWSNPAVDIVVPLGLLAAWGYFVAWPGKQSRDWIVAEMFLALALFATIGAIAPPAQYAAVAFKRPLIDYWLAAGDAALGADVEAWAAWVSERQLFLRILLYAYLSLLVQFLLPLLLLGVWYRNRIALWEYVFHFHVCSAITITCLALWPVAGAFSFYGFDPPFNLSRYVAQFSGVYSGSLTTIRSEDMEGLVSMPSFHVAGAAMVTWALRQSRFWLWILVPLNVTLTAATVLTGTHYVTDLIGTAVMCAFSLWLFRRFARQWLY